MVRRLGWKRTEDSKMEWKRGVEVGVEEDCGGWGGRGVWRMGWKGTVEDGVEEGCGGLGGRVL